MKNKELNLAELLKDCPKGTKFYCLVEGEVEFRGIDKDGIDIIGAEFNYVPLDHFGRYCGKGECVLFPSKENRDWNNFQVSQIRVPKHQIGDYIKFEGNIDLIPIVYKILDIDNRFYKIDAINDNEVSTQSLSLFDPILENSIKVNQFDPKWLKPFDKVLVRTLNDIGNYEPYIYTWNIEYFGYIDFDSNEYHTISGTWKQCIPYNAETKHLIGTTEKAPEFYINWEE